MEKKDALQHAKNLLAGAQIATDPGNSAALCAIAAGLIALVEELREHSDGNGALNVIVRDGDEMQRDAQAHWLAFPPGD